VSDIAAILERTGQNREDVLRSMERGAIVVRYPYVISAVLVSFALESRAVLIERPAQRYTGTIPYLLLTLVFGWWGVPWGPIFTAKAVWCLMRGGEEITDSIHEELQSSMDYTT
jgi:hypothetical protein